MSGIPGYDAWKLASPPEEPDEEVYCSRIGCGELADVRDIPEDGETVDLCRFHMKHGLPSEQPAAQPPSSALPSNETSD